MRTQGVHFSIENDRLNQVASWAAGREGVIVTTEDILDIALDTDWPNATEHQAWLDSASPTEIASWVTDICLDMQQEMTKQPKA